MQSAEDDATRTIAKAKALAASGGAREAATLLRSLLARLHLHPSFRDLRNEAYSGLIQIDFFEGRFLRAEKSFRLAIADMAWDAAPSYDDMYFKGCIATGTMPTPLHRRNRFLNLVRQLDEVQGLKGRIAECGCFRGLSSFLLCSRLAQHDPRFDGTGHEIYDSFQGLSEPQAEDQPEDPSSPQATWVRPMMKRGMYAWSLEGVRQALSGFPGIAYFPGWIPEAFAPDNSASYRFVHVDVDLYQPTIAAFRYFWPRMVPGARLVCDDYGWAGAKRAATEFSAEIGVSYEVSENLQAIFLKTGQSDRP